MWHERFATNQAAMDAVLELIDEIDVAFF